MAARTRARGPFDYWPGFVDALSTLVLAIVFMLSIFMLGQFFLAREISGRESRPVRRTLKFSTLKEDITVP